MPELPGQEQQWPPLRVCVPAVPGLLPAGPPAGLLLTATKSSSGSTSPTPWPWILQGNFLTAPCYETISQDENINLIFKVSLFEYFNTFWNPAIFSAAARQEKEEWILFHIIKLTIFFLILFSTAKC